MSTEQEKIDNGQMVKAFLQTPGGQHVLGIIKDRIDLIMREARHADDKRTVGALVALQDTLSAIWGSVSIGEIALYRAEMASKREVEYEQGQARRPPKGVPAPRRNRGTTDAL